MKKLLTCLLIVLILGGVFCIAIQTNNNIKKDAPVIGSVLEFISPQLAYADSDTVGGIPPSPPPPPID